jgi:uncharacterized membrane protein YwaF
MIVLLVRRYRSLPPGLAWGSPRRRQLLVMAILPPLLISTRMAQLISHDVFWPIFWPLHICNLCEYLWVIYALHPHGRFGDALGNLLFCWSIVGGAGALLVPGWASYSPLLCWSSLCGFFGHALFFASTICVLAGCDLIPNIRWIWVPIIAAIVGGAFFYAFNAQFGTNFFFTDPYAAGVPFSTLADLFGPSSFFAAYLAAAIILWVCFYGVHAWVTRR